MALDPGPTRPPILRFGIFELDQEEAVLRKNGRVVRIQDQPLRLLAILAEHSGALVTREQLRGELWPEGDFVDFDKGLNTAVNRLRVALGDSAENPRFIQTVPRRGYRFVAPLEKVAGDPEPAPESRPLAPKLRAAGPVTITLTGLALIAVFVLPMLRKDAPAQASPQKIMLAVLPFVDVSPVPEAYLGDGLTEELIARLGAVAPGRLGVIARTSVMTYKGTTDTVERIGSELDVDYVLEGSVRRDDGDLRITVRLVEVDEQTQLWANTYQLPFRDVLGAQIDVSRRVAQRLAEDAILPQAGQEDTSVDPRAYDAYLKGMYFRDMLTEQGFRDGIELFEESVSYEPDFARAYAGMAACYCLLSGHGLEVDQPAVLMTKARDMAEQALRLDPDLPMARGALGMAKLKYDWDWEGAEAEFVRALEINPHEPAVHIWYAFLLSSQSRHREALDHAETARELDRFSRIANLNVAWRYYEARRYERAVEEFDATLELHPGSWIAHWGRGLVYSQQGQHAAARADLDVAVELSGRHSSALGAAGLVLARAGERERANELLQELTERSVTQYVPPSVVAGICAALGEIDRAFEWLDKAYELRSRSLVWLAVAHEFDPLRSDPRYDELLRRMRLEDGR